MHKGPKKFGGCPEGMLDVDNDGIPDAQDKCKQQAEDKDGYQDTDGCPDPDNDGDGVCDDNSVIQEDLDAHAKVCKGTDKCPKELEDRDGHEDEDGCPDPDNDGDGVCDNNPQVQKNLSRYRSVCIGRDRCPKRKETINGRRDQDGCPDRGSPEVVVQGKQVRTARIAFKRKTTRFAGRTRRVLMQLAAVLRTRKDIRRLVIVGFTEPRMSRAVSVSQAWAEAVRAFLISQGISGSRLIAKGLGGVKPVYTGSSRSKSKKINRRVEFYIVTPKEE
jgi:outer membrane protein OmpA-like peptidoglycan-associated protein